MKTVLKILKIAAVVVLGFLCVCFVLIAADPKQSGSVRAVSCILAVLAALCVWRLILIGRRVKPQPEMPGLDIRLEAPEPQPQASQERKADPDADPDRLSYLVADPLALAREDGVPASFVAFDVETTGLSPSLDRIVEIGAVLVLDGVPSRQFQTLVNPGRRMPPEATRKNHITDEMLADAPRIDAVLPEFFAFISDLPIAAHNARFDASFLVYEGDRIGLTLQNPVADTLALSRQCWPRLERHRLVDVCEKIGYENDQEHRALSDAMAVAAIVNAAGVQRTAYARHGRAFDQHCQISNEIRDKYREAKREGAAPEAMDVVLALCRQDIALADSVVPYCRDTDRRIYYDSFKLLVRQLQLRGEHKEAVRVCDRAIALGLNDDGTKGGMEARRQKSLAQLETAQADGRRG